MNPDFTLIWPLSCLKDEDHLCFRLSRPDTHHEGAGIFVFQTTECDGQRRFDRLPRRRASDAS